MIFTFWILLSLIFYCYCGFPLLLAVVARLDFLEEALEGGVEPKQAGVGAKCTRCGCEACILKGTVYRWCAEARQPGAAGRTYGAPTSHETAYSEADLRPPPRLPR